MLSYMFFMYSFEIHSNLSNLRRSNFPEMVEKEQSNLSTGLKDNLPHNTCQIYVKPQSKNTHMTLECQIFDEKALR